MCEALQPLTQLYKQTKPTQLYKTCQNCSKSTNCTERNKTFTTLYTTSQNFTILTQLYTTSIRLYKTSIAYLDIQKHKTLRNLTKKTTKLDKAPQNFRIFYTKLYNFTPLYETLQNYTQLYKTIQHFAQLYRTSQKKKLYTNTKNYTKLYETLHN